MIRIQDDDVSGFLIETTEVTHHQKVNVVFVASGAMGQRLNSHSHSTDNAKDKTVISFAQAESALQQLFMALPLNHAAPSLTDLLQMNPSALSMMMTQLALGVFGNNAQSLCQQLERATEVQRFLRDKRVAEYQEQIQKSVEQLDKARKAGIVNALFDWVIGGVEAVIGVMKMAEGLLTADPLACVDGAAYFSAGMSGMVKAATETAQLAGADKNTCQQIIDRAGTAQLSCEGIAMALDILQIGRGFVAARAVVSATGKALDSGMGERLLESMVNMTEEAAAKELATLSEELAAEVGNRLGQDFGMTAEREMVEAGNMAAEASARSADAEARMVRAMGKSFTRAGVESMVKEAVKTGVKTLLKEGVELTEEKIRNAIIRKLRARIMYTLLTANVNTTLQTIRATSAGGELIAQGIIDATAAATRKQIELLITQQSFIDFIEDWTEAQKKTQQNRLKEAYQGGSEAIKSALEMIDDYGTVLAGIAVGRA